MRGLSTVSPIEAIGFVGYSAVDPIRGFVAELVDEKDLFKNIDKKREREFITVAVGLMASRGALADLAVYLGTEPEDTGITLARCIAARFVPDMVEDDLVEAYNIAGDWIVGRDQHAALAQLYEAAYEGSPLTKMRIQVWVASGLLDFPVLGAPEVLAELAPRIDWNLGPDSRSPGFDAYAAKMVARSAKQARRQGF